MGASVNPWEHWLLAKQHKHFIEKLEEAVLTYNSKNARTKNSPLLTYLLLLPYEGEVLSAIESAKKNNPGDPDSAAQDAYSKIVEVLLSDEGGKTVDHHFKRRAVLHSLGYVVVILMMIGTSGTNSSSMFNFLISDEVGVEFGAYENIVKAFLYTTSMMAQWMMYRKAVPDMMNKIFSAPHGEWGFLETRSLEFAQNSKGDGYELKYRTEVLGNEWGLVRDSQNQQIFKLEDKIKTPLGVLTNTQIKVQEGNLIVKKQTSDSKTGTHSASAQEWVFDTRNMSDSATGNIDIDGRTYSYTYDQKKLTITAPINIKTSRKNVGSFVENIRIDEKTARFYGIWEEEQVAADEQGKKGAQRHVPKQIKIGTETYQITKNVGEENYLSIDVDLSKLPHHGSRRWLMYGLSACTFLMVVSLGMLILEKVAKLLEKKKEDDGLFGLSEDISFGIGAALAGLIGLGVVFLWTKVLREKFKEKEKEEKRDMLLAALMQLKIESQNNDSTPNNSSNDKPEKPASIGNLFHQFFVPTEKDANNEEKTNWFVVFIVGVGLISSIMAQTKNTFGLIDGWANDHSLLPNTGEYDPIDTTEDFSAWIIVFFFLFVITAPGSRFIFSCFSLTNLFKLMSALKTEAMKEDVIKKELTTYKVNYAVGCTLMAGILAVFIASLIHEDLQKPLTNGQHGWMTGNDHGMITPTGLAILGAVVAWGLFKWFRPPIKPLDPLLNLKDSSDSRTGQQVFAAIVNALSFGAIGGGGMIFFFEDVLHIPFWFDNDHIDAPHAAEWIIKIGSFLAMVTLGLASLATSMQPVRLSEAKKPENDGIKRIQSTAIISDGV